MQQSQSSTRHTAARYLKSLATARGSPVGALAFAESQAQWLDQRQVVSSLKTAVAASGASDFAVASVVAESFNAALHDFSVPLRMAGSLKMTPMFVQIYTNAAGAIAVRVAEGASIPVVRGNWAVTILKPVKHAGIIVQTEELVQSASPTAAAAMLDDLAQAVAEAENLSFIAPGQAGSVLSTATAPFAATGAAIANVDADLKRLVDQVPGAHQGAAYFLMAKETATFLSLLRGSGGAAASPGITPLGGSLLGIPVLVTAACQIGGSPVGRIVALVDANAVHFADEGHVELMASKSAALQQDSAPTENSLTPTATSTVSMFQANAIALRAIRESAWFARPGASSYFTSGY